MTLGFGRRQLDSDGAELFSLRGRGGSRGVERFSRKRSGRLWAGQTRDGYQQLR